MVLVIPTNQQTHFCHLAAIVLGFPLSLLSANEEAV